MFHKKMVKGWFLIRLCSLDKRRSSEHKEINIR